QHLTRPPPPLPRTPAGLAAVVGRALEKRREARFASMAAFAAALADPEGFAAGAVASRPALPLPPPRDAPSVITQHPPALPRTGSEIGAAPPPSPRARLAVIGVSGLVALAIIGAGVLFVGGRRAAVPDAGRAPAIAPPPPPPIVVPIDRAPPTV